MKVGDLVEWEWYLGTDWETTKMTGVILRTSFNLLPGPGPGHAYFICHVMSNDGIVEVRSDTTVMRMIGRHANEDSSVV